MPISFVKLNEQPKYVYQNGGTNGESGFDAMQNTYGVDTTEIAIGGANVTSITVTTAGTKYKEIAYETLSSGWHVNSILTDGITKQSFKLKARSASRAVQKGLLEAVRARTGCNIVGFFLTNSIRGTVGNELRYQNDDSFENKRIEDRIMEQFKRDRVAILKEAGYNEYYIVKDDMSFEDEFEVEANADIKDIARAFRKMQKGKVLNRVLLNRFITMIA
mgnify:CR=1 FL=1